MLPPLAAAAEDQKTEFRVILEFAWNGGEWITNRTEILAVAERTLVSSAWPPRLYARRILVIQPPSGPHPWEPDAPHRLLHLR